MTTLVSAGVPVGTILAFGGDDTNIPDGFLLCDSSLLNRNTYAELFSAIGTHWGTTTGTNFALPNTEGLLLRGRANGAGADPDRASRTQAGSGGSSGDQVGSYQSNRYGNHSHGGSASSHNHLNGMRYSDGVANNCNTYGATGFLGSFQNIQSPYGGSNHKQVYTSSTAPSLTVNASGYNQTVGENVYVNYIIKY